MLNVGNTQRRELQKQKQGLSMLSMYNEAPLVEVSLEEFEEFAIDRLHGKRLDYANFRLRSVAAKDREVKLEKTLNKHLPLRSAAPLNAKKAEADAMKDVLSHFFLRMAFCQTEELRRWFLSQESTLYRLDALTRGEKLQFMKLNGLSYQEVATRRVYIEAGTAYVPFDHVVSILYAAFRANLSKQLSSAFRKYNRSLISKDDRLAPVLSNLAKHHIDADYSVQAVPGSENSVTPDMIDGLAASSMPLCMRSLHKALKLNHHMKFAGRQQYGLFLKGIGLQLDDAIAYWKQEFCKKMSVDDFNKKYAYNIRHNYGKEGKRKDYAPSNCMRIITGEPPKNGEYHGCPFRHFEQEHLRKALQGVSEGGKQEILSLVENHHYQIACKKYFEATHPGGDADVIVNHPNGYFDESRKYYAAKDKGVTVPSA
ncbi:hypothetical protein BBJ28_00011524 [Nothophytophthora sp. Chile5]|nr:hypothetical protein BBJ28_00011524 [Nothophytophthora sp. Chile5]